MDDKDMTHDMGVEQSPMIFRDELNNTARSSLLPSAVENKDTATDSGTSETPFQNTSVPMDNSALQPSSECAAPNTEMSQATSVDQPKATNSDAPPEGLSAAIPISGYVDLTTSAPIDNLIANNSPKMPTRDVAPGLQPTDEGIPLRVFELASNPQNSFAIPEPLGELPADYFQLPSNPLNRSTPKSLSKEMKDILLARQYKYREDNSGELENDILPFMQGRERETPHHRSAENAPDLDAKVAPGQLNDKDEEEPLSLDSSEGGYDSDTGSIFEEFENNAEDLGAFPGTKRMQGTVPEAAPATAIKKKRAATGPANEIRGTGKQAGNGLPKLRRADIKKQRVEGNLFNPARLARSNAFHDHDSDSTRGERPTFTSTVKKDAFKELAASIPLDSKPMSKYDLAQINLATRSFTGRGNCKADGKGAWLPKGMKSSLSHYQLLGTAFMREREKGNEEPRGGIQGDAMGLGKTVMALANIVDGQLLKPNQTTLIVVPASLIPQWEREIPRHTDWKVVGNVLAYYSRNKIHSSNLVETFSQYGIILTTYDEMRRSYPKSRDPPAECSTPDEKALWLEKYYEANMGIFHKFQFHRLILDEAQAIKNPESATCLAACNIRATHRWIMSGTPLQDNPGELYAYFRFLRVPTFSCPAEFQRDYLTDSEGRTRLHLLLRKYMVRRGYEDKLIGEKLLDIPKATTFDYPCFLSTIERKIYEVVYRRVLERINGMLQAENEAKSYRHIFQLFLLLRKIVDHPLLVHDDLKTVLEKEDFDELDQIVREEATEGQDALVKNLRVMFRKARLARSIESQDDAASLEQTSDSAIVDSGGLYGAKADFRSYFDHLRKKYQADGDDTEKVCAVCNKPPEDIQSLECRHSYCFNCFIGHIATSRKNGILYPTCVQCPEMIQFGPGLIPDPEMRHAASLNMRDPTKISQQQKLRNADLEIERWIKKDGDMIPSSKTLAIKAQILEWLQEDPNKKIIVFSHFIMMIRILAKMCKLERWEAVEYTGLNNADIRDKTISHFSCPDGPQIMLASVKAGGVGLNLTMASKCIIVDPWWNNAVEQQAFGRIYRKGQAHETTLTRFIVQDTIETKMIGMQKRKEKEIDCVIIGTGSNQKLSKAEILSLFGQIERDEHGNRRIVPHNE